MIYGIVINGYQKIDTVIRSQKNYDGFDAGKHASINVQ